MNYSVVSLLDLPDEILLIILTKLNNANVLYSFIGVNERLDKIACDIIFTRSIDLVTISSNDEIDSMADRILNRFCLDILPRIHQNVECLTLEPSSMECILHASNYPNLHKLNLVEFDFDQALHYFNDESPFIYIFKKQISHLVITIIDDTDSISLVDLAIDVYARIFALFINLTHLEFGVYHTPRHPTLLLRDLPSNICFSTNIVHLCVKVLFFEDCLCLLDGRLYQMNTLIVTVEYFMPYSSTTINNTKGLHNLKCFSLMSRSKITTYDNQIVPLLRQMSQLEKLILSLKVHNRTTFIEGTHLNNVILNQMSHLHTFIFDIVTHCAIVDENPKSPDDIRCTFVQDVDCYIDYLSNGEGRCHIYSFPFTMEYLHSITNSFPGGIFMSVRILSILDGAHPFEHDFFERISHSFPLLHRLTVLNMKPQNENQTSSIVQFPHLSQLDLEYAHVDYIKQFLFNTNTDLPCLNQLEIQFEQLANVTENFTNNIARVNCAKVKRLLLRETIVHSIDFYLYFPLL